MKKIIIIIFYYYYFYYYYNGETSALGSCLEILLFEVGIRARIGDQGRIQGGTKRAPPPKIGKNMIFLA
jgi:hypothetical protein